MLLSLAAASQAFATALVEVGQPPASIVLPEEPPQHLALAALEQETDEPLMNHPDH
jgi:hypothetical protein